MNKKAITAIENKKLLKNIKKNNNIKFIYKNIQYREAIIEILKKEKDIGIIFISEDIPGEISIEELINEIKLINKKIEIIFFLNKKNKNKEEKLKKIKVNKIYYIKKINNEYRNIDKETDVLSFPMFEKNEIDELIENQNNVVEDVLGDIIISVDRVKEQAVEYGHSFERELAYMVVHGFYHLMGYDHMNDDEKSVMRAKEENILSKLKITR